jgi:hypothetical protein
MKLLCCVYERRSCAEVAEHFKDISYSVQVLLVPGMLPFRFG